MDYSIKIDIQSIRGAQRVTTATKQVGIFIPISSLYDTGTKAMLDVIASEPRTPSQYGDTHYLKQSFSKAERERLTDAEKKVYLGNMRPFKSFANADAAPIGALTPQPSATEQRQAPPTPASDRPF